MEELIKAIEALIQQVETMNQLLRQELSQVEMSTIGESGPEVIARSVRFLNNGSTVSITGEKIAIRLLKGEQPEMDRS